MKVEIKSKQNYGTYTEETSETFECEKRVENDRVEIWNENIHILIEENKIIQTRNSNEIVVEVGRTNLCRYKTEQGSFEMEITGISIDMQENLTRASYQIKISGALSYTNEIEIIM